MRKKELPHYTYLTNGQALCLDWLSSVSVNDYQSARPLNWHEHAEMEIIFPIRGKFNYEFSDAEPVEVDGNSFLCIPPQANHRLRDAIDTPGNRFSLHLSAPARHLKNGPLKPREYRHLYEELLRRACLRESLSSFQKAAVSCLWQLTNRPQAVNTPHDLLRMRILICQLLCECTVSVQQIPRRSEDEIVQTAKQWLRENAAGSVNLDSVVSFIGYSRARFFASFKEQTGMTPGDYLRDYRIAQAKRLLAETSLQSAAIAKACGLGTGAHFCRVFQKMTGQAPLAYRKTIQAERGA